MEVVTPQEFSCLAMVFPKFKGLPGRKWDNWRPRPVAIILLDKSHEIHAPPSKAEQ
jgi:hypothetical protein